MQLGKDLLINYLYILFLKMACGNVIILLFFTTLYIFVLFYMCKIFLNKNRG